MLRIIVATAVAMVGTIPSFLFAKAWLKRNDVEVTEEGVVPTFLEHAPSHLKVGAVAANLVIGGGLFLVVFFGIPMLLS